MNRQFFICALLASFLLCSCTNLRSVSKRKYRPGFFVQFASVNEYSSSAPNHNNDATCEFTAIECVDDTNSTEVLPESVVQKEHNDEALESQIVSKNNSCVQQDGDTAKILELSSSIGPEIDSTEKANHKLFPFWKNDEFVSAHFEQQKDGRIILVGKLKNGTIEKKLYSKQKYEKLQESLVMSNPSLGAMPPKERISMQDKVDAEAAERAGRRSLLLVLLPIVFLIVHLIIINSVIGLSASMWGVLVPAFFGIFLILGMCQAIIAIRRRKAVKKRHPDEAEYEYRLQAKHGRNMGVLSLILAGPIVAFLLMLGFLILSLR